MRILGSITVFYENMNELLERLTAIFGILSYAVSEKQRILGILEPMTGFDENRNRRCEIWNRRCEFSCMSFLPARQSVSSN